jgi:23S rRNA (cytosine1962-C5)-methyltransferase
VSRRSEPASLLLAALQRRAALLDDPQTTTCRLFNGRGDGIDGLVIERYGPILIVQLHQGRLVLGEDHVRDLARCAADRVGAAAVYAKYFPKNRSGAAGNLDARHRDPKPWIGEPVEPEFNVLENGVRFRVRPYDGYSVGLFLDQRENRSRVRALAAGRRMLNTFAYTCGFSVVASAGGATSTVSVDASRRYLEWGKRNLQANNLSLRKQDNMFVRSDVFDYFRRARRQGRRFDMIVLDPPSFARVKGSQRTFVLTEQLDALVSGAVERLDPGGIVLLCTNHRRISHRRMEQALRAACSSRRLAELKRLALPSDFAADPGYARSLLARVH